MINKDYVNNAQTTQHALQNVLILKIVLLVKTKYLILLLTLA